MKRIVAFSAGKRGGNSEIFAKEALLAAERKGVEVELIRLFDCELEACLGCDPQPCMSKGPSVCPLKDDGEWLVEKFLNSDGYLLSAPVWSLSPNATVTVFRDRVFGPKMDTAAGEFFGGNPEWIDGRIKARPGALISVGGARTEHWTSLGLPTLYTTTFSAQTNVVDHMNVTEVSGKGMAVTREDLLQKARNMGENLAYAVLNSNDERWMTDNRWLGEDTATACPGCHLDLVLFKPGTKKVTCAVCGRNGEISVLEGEIVISFPEGDKDDRLTPEGKVTHIKEIIQVDRERYSPNIEMIREKMKFYNELNYMIQKPPSKTK